MTLTVGPLFSGIGGRRPAGATVTSAARFFISPATHGSLLSARDRILDALGAEVGHRTVHADWENREREAVTTAANRYAVNHGLHTVTVDDVLGVEPLAVGHVDYAPKLALYVAELVHGLRQVRR